MWQEDLERFRRALAGKPAWHVQGVEEALCFAHGQVVDALPLDAPADVYASVNGSFAALIRAVEEARR